MAEEYSFLISNPPHDDPDVGKAAPLLGLVPAELRMRANYAAPEIWLGDPDHGKLEATARALQESGLNAVVVRADAFAAVPSRASVKSFSFGDSELVSQADTDEVKLPFDQPMTAVFCQPGEGQMETGRRTGDAMTEGLRRRSSSVFVTRDSLVGFGSLRASSSGLGGEGGEGEGAHPAFLDIYVAQADQLRRISIVEGTVDFSGLGDLMVARSTDNMVMFAAEFEDKFPAAVVDRSLVDLNPRPHPTVGGVALWTLLEMVCPDLERVDHYDLASRLVYLARASSP
jgi:hypothetical protein